MIRESFMHLTNSWMHTGAVKHENNPEYEPNTPSAPECVEHGLPAKFFGHYTADRVAQNQPKLLSCKIKELVNTLMPNSVCASCNIFYLR